MVPTPNLSCARLEPAFPNSAVTTLYSMCKRSRPQGHFGYSSAVWSPQCQYLTVAVNLKFVTIRRCRCEISPQYNYYLSWNQGAGPTYLWHAHSDEGPMLDTSALKLFSMANLQFINSVDNTKLPCYDSSTDAAPVSLETYPLYFWHPFVFNIYLLRMSWAKLFTWQ